MTRQGFESTVPEKINTCFAPDGLPVVFITDTGYLEPTLLAIFSLCRHAGTATKYNINLVMAGCSPESRDRVKSTFPGINIISVPIPQSNVMCKSNVTLTALLKFDLPELLPSCSRVLYLDGDVLVRSDLSELINLPFQDGKMCGAVKDCKAIIDGYPQKNQLKIGNGYFNSGVLLLNLAAMRANHTSEQLWKIRSEINLRFMDQDCFNIVFADKVFHLPFTYNMMMENIKKTTLSMRTIAEIYETTEAKFTTAFAAPAIVHYSSPKPWNSTRTSGYEYYWEEKSLFDLYVLKSC